MYIRVNDHRYYVEIEGEGFPIVFFHGFTGTTKTWKPFVKELSSTYQCVTIDLPGHGKTDVKNMKDMDEACYELNEVINKLGIDKMHLVGYSMGGRTALVYATTFPNQLKSLVLCGASPGLNGDEKANRIENDERLANKIRQEGINAFVHYWENIPLFNSQKRLPERVKQNIKEERLSQREDGLALSLQTMGTGMQRSMWDFLSTLNIPTLLITGEMDEKFTDINQKMNEQLPLSEHKIVPNVGHAVHIEAPHEFLNELKNFIQSQ